MDKDALIAQITAAFDGVSREGGVSLREGQVLDDYGTPEECAAACLLDTDTCWQEVSDADMQEYWASFGFLDAIGFRYYLPALMLRDLRLFVHPKYGISGDALDRLDPHNRTNLHDYIIDQFSLLTLDQGRSVCRFLEFNIAHGAESDRKNAAKYLSDYWSRYQ